MPIDATQVLAALQQLPAEQEAAFTESLTQACLKVEHDAKANITHNNTGTLRRSITYVVTKENGMLAGYVGSNLDYAPYYHQGTGIYAINGLGRRNVPWRYKDNKGQWHTTSGMHPTPFLQNAVDSNRQDILNYFKGVLGNGNN